jgi:uncharacterized repeat protein (TIGR01451 family)
MNIASLKFIPLTLMALVVMGVSAAHAADPSPLFNMKQSDSDFLTAKNLNGGTSYVDPLAAKAGDIVEVALYYHNGVIDSTATNTIAQAVLGNENSTTHVITGSLQADNAPKVTGTIVDGKEIGKKDLTITTDSNTTLQFVPGSVRLLRCNNAAATSSTDCPLAQINFPSTSNPDSIVTTGVNIGSVQGCFQYSGYVLFNVKLNGTVAPQPATLQVKKLVRRVNSTDAFATSTNANPGDQLQYEILVTNIDNSTSATNVMLQDILPSGVTANGAIHLGIGGVAQPDVTYDWFNKSVLLASTLKPNQTLQISFLADTAKSISDKECRVNEVDVTATGANVTGSPAKATTCFVVVVQPTAQPTVAPTVPPQPTVAPTAAPIAKPITLPKTGPETALAIPGLFSGLTVAMGTVQRRRNLKRAIRKIEVL